MPAFAAVLGLVAVGAGAALLFGQKPPPPPPPSCDPTSCPPPGLCVGSVCTCPSPNVVIGGRCVSSCTQMTCPPPGLCVNNRCTCPAPNRLIGGVCVGPCDVVTCPPPGLCVNNQCTCPAPNRLIGGVCTPHAPSAVTVRINGNLWPSLNPAYVRAGDQFSGQCVRAGHAETPISLADFQRALGQYETPPASEDVAPGIAREVVFSAIGDLATYVGRLPANVVWCTYDFEGSMTPAAEYSNPLASATQFAQICHAHGKRCSFVPISFVLGKLAQNGQLATIAQSADEVGWQAQNQVTTMTDAQYRQQVASFAHIVRTSGSSVMVQLWSPTETVARQIQLFNEIIGDGTVDCCGIGTHSLGTAVAQILAGLAR